MKLSEEKIDSLINDVKTIVKQWGTNRTGLLTILFIVFVTLKLTGYISWSWWWVTAPLWGGLALFIFILMLCILLLFLAYILK